MNPYPIQKKKEGKRMNIAVIYDTKTGTTAAAAEYIKEGALSAGVNAETYQIGTEDAEAVKAADAVIIGAPTYYASITPNMLNWLQTTGKTLGMAGKLGGAFATEQYIHGGAENVISTILTHEMVFGMMVWSGGGSFGKPIIHLGPVGMSPDIETFKELFVTFGKRFAEKCKSLR